VNLGVAKDQRLSLNPSQISGACGRLMCSLRYEHEFYVQSRRRFPKEGRVFRTTRGEEKVITNDIFRDRVTLRGTDGDTRTIALAELRREVEQVAAELGLPAPAIGHAAAGDGGGRRGAAERGARDQDGPAPDTHEPLIEVASAGDSEDSQPHTGATPLAEVTAVTSAEGTLGEDEAAIAEQTGETGDTGTPGKGRPRRRRGRRGGRRNRSGGAGGPRGPTAAELPPRNGE
jgi:hypothetical protein